MHSPHSTKLLEPDKSKQDQAFATAKPLAVAPPLLLAFCDSYIDDLITMAVQLSNQVQKAQQDPPLAVHLVFRPVDPQEPLPRADATSLRKLSGEGQPSETKNGTGLGHLHTVIPHLPTSRQGRGMVP